MISQKIRAKASPGTMTSPMLWIQGHSVDASFRLSTTWK